MEESEPYFPSPKEIMGLSWFQISFQIKGYQPGLEALGRPWTWAQCYSNTTFVTFQSQGWENHAMAGSGCPHPSPEVMAAPSLLQDPQGVPGLWMESRWSCCCLWCVPPKCPPTCSRRWDTPWGEGVLSVSSKGELTSWNRPTSRDLMRCVILE